MLAAAVIAQTVMKKGKKRTAAALFDDAEAQGFTSNAQCTIDGEVVFGPLESGTEINYDRMMALWDE